MIGNVSIVTPSYLGDLDRCQLLCDTMDRYCTGFSRHCIVVDDEDLAVFARLAGPTRHVIATSSLLPKFWTVAQWRGRRYRWRPGMRLPIYGWHLQQLRKIAFTLAQDADRVVCIDSDVCFCRSADLGELAAADRTPLSVQSQTITSAQPNHVRWRENAYRALGVAAPPLPGDDFIGQMITWDRATMKTITDRIEQVNGRPWWEVLARQRDFSEYLIYGAAVSGDMRLKRGHEPVDRSPCFAYWSGPPLDARSLEHLIAQLQPDQYALAIQSHTRTPLTVIRSAVMACSTARKGSSTIYRVSAAVPSSR